MSDDNKQIVQSSLPVLPLLGAVLVTLKLTGHITASWTIVLAPFWVPVAIFTAILLLIGLAFVIFAAIDKIRR